MSDALTRLALEAPTDAAARRIFEGGERDARNDPAARPRLLERGLRERNGGARVRRRESRDGNGLGLALLVGLTVLAALAVAYLLTTGRVPMILARLTYRTQ